MLRITGPAVKRQQYLRIPMEDAIGAVSAYIHPTHVHYRPKGGTKMELLTRARIIAAEQGGRVILWGDPENPNRHHYLAEVAYPEEEQRHG